MTQEELNEILELHAKWLRGEEDGAQALLSFQDLSNLSLVEADLTRSICVGTDFTGCDLSETNFSDSSLKGALFTGAAVNATVFDGCNLEKADFVATELQGVSFYASDVKDTDFSDASFYEVKAVSTNFEAANLTNVVYLTEFLEEIVDTAPTDE
jgi:uncharacterized protein YjbI with pentapeptide repeats